MKLKSLFLVAWLITAAGVLMGCGEQEPSGPSPILITINNTQTQGGPGTQASPTPGAGGVITTVKVTQFGETCPSGKSVSGEARSVRVGCEKHLTCTPFMADGTMAPAALHGPTPDFFGLVAGGNFTSVTTPGEAYNRDARGTAPGVSSFSCTVKGIRSEQFDLTVIQ